MLQALHISIQLTSKRDIWLECASEAENDQCSACSLFRRIDERVAALGADAKAKAELRKLGRKLRSVHEELGQYNKTLASFLDTHPDEWESMVAASRTALTTEFFDHMENLIHAAVSDKARQEGEARLEIARLSANFLYSFCKGRSAHMLQGRPTGPCAVVPGTWVNT